MSIETFLQFFMTHNQLIINGLFVLVLICSALVALFSLSERHSQGGTSEAPAGQVESTLRKILDEKLPLVGTQVPAAAPVAIPQGDDLVPAEMARALQLELETRKAELAKLQAELQAQTAAQADAQANAPAAPAGEVDPGLKARLDELEAKLAEYSIIEDDIADLCLYKEENARLKEEITRLSSSVSTPQAAPEASTPVEAPVAAQPSPAAVAALPEEPVIDVAAEMSPATPIMEEPAAPAAEASAMDDLEAEFAAAVAAQQSEEKSQRENVEEPTSPPNLTLIQGGDSNPDGALNDVINQAFASDDSSAVTVPPSPEPLTEELDTERMMAEMASLNSLDEVEEDAGVLEEDQDTDKMTQEAEALDQLAKG